MVLLRDLLILPWLCWLLHGAGRGVLLVVSRNRTEWRVARVWIAVTVGNALLSAAIFTLGTFHVFQPGVVWPALVCATLFLGLSSWRAARRSDAIQLRQWLVRWDQFTASTKLLALLIVFVVGLALSGACTPEVRGDPIIYHISEALLYLVNGGHVEIRSSALTYIPQNQQIVYALGLMLGDDSLAKMMHWLAGVLLLAGTAAWTRRLGGSIGQGIMAAALVALFPMWIYLATTTYVDLAAGNYILAGLFCLLVALERGVDGSAEYLLAGALLGLAMGTKYTAAIVGFLPALCLCTVSASQRRCRLSHVGLLVAGAFVAFAPWLVRNWMWTGNPLAPSLLRLLGPPRVPQSTLDWPDIQAGTMNNWWPPSRLLGAYADMLMSLGDYGNFVITIAALLGFAGLALGPEARAAMFPRLVRMVIWFVAIAFLFGVPVAAVRRDSRYIMAHVALAAALIGFWHGHLLSLAAGHHPLLKKAGVVVFAVIVLSWVGRTYVSFKDLGETLLPVITEPARHAYRRARLANYDGNVALGSHAWAGPGRILGAAYPARVNYVLGGAPLTSDFLIQRTEQVTTDTFPALKRQGVKYLFGTVAAETLASLRPRGSYVGIPLYEVPDP